MEAEVDSLLLFMGDAEDDEVSDSIRKAAEAQEKFFEEFAEFQIKIVKTAILEIQINASLSGHDLGPSEPVDTVSGGYEVYCRKCGQLV